ncbi:hypothetical protein F4780DRAFT_134498 [Xylariomycetidae sp. FL0641]|nr:hypothetical protein F4780DRAFT_134498 [Xylariomycetidae sp. FL0641]
MASNALNGNGKRLAPPSSGASPSPNTSPHKADGKRQKRDRDGIKDHASPTPAALAAQQAASDFGSHMMTQLAYAVDFLKAKRAPKTPQDILDHLSLNTIPEQQKAIFVSLMQNHGRIEHLPPPAKLKPGDPQLQQPAWARGKYQFKAKIPGVHDKVTLLAHLQAKTDASALSVKDLKDGWPDCDGAIAELEEAHRILVVRTKKDNHAKFIWLDDSSLAPKVDAEFQSMWSRVELPSLDDIVRKLAAVGQKPASEDPRLKKIEGPKQNAAKKRKSARPPKHQSNAHMAHLLKDFSHLKR